MSRVESRRRRLRSGLVAAGIAVAIPSAFASAQAVASEPGSYGMCTYPGTILGDRPAGVVGSGDGCGCIRPCPPPPRCGDML